MHHNGSGSAPNNAPTAVDAYLEGGPGALGPMSVLADVALPTSTVWGEFASFSMIDAPAARQYYAQGELDFSTPPVNAKNELLPALSRGHQVVLPGLGHTNDFWEHRPDAGKHLLTTFFDSGRVDSSQFDRRPVAFDAVPLSMSTIAGLLVGVTTGGALLGLLVLGLLARRRLRRGAPGHRAGRWLRVLTVVPLGLAGWFLGALFAWTLAPGWFIAGPAVVVPGTGLPARRRRWRERLRERGWDLWSRPAWWLRPSVSSARRWVRTSSSCFSDAVPPRTHLPFEKPCNSDLKVGDEPGGRSRRGWTRPPGRERVGHQVDAFVNPATRWPHAGPAGRPSCSARARSGHRGRLRTTACSPV